MARLPKSDFDRRDLQLTGAFAGPPLIWFAHLSVGYSLVPSVCSSGDRTPLHLLTALAMLMTAGIAWFAFRVIRRIGEGTTNHGEKWLTRERFMATVALVFGITFTVTIGANEVAFTVLRSCG